MWAEDRGAGVMLFNWIAITIEPLRSPFTVPSTAVSRAAEVLVGAVEHLHTARRQPAG
jgi:hypothetical protein